MASIVRKGWPFRGDFNWMISKLMESGFTEKWYNDIEFSITLKKQIEMVKEGLMDDGSATPFTISQLIASFYLLAIGLILSTVVLIGERIRFSKLKFLRK